MRVIFTSTAIYSVVKEQYESLCVLTSFGPFFKQSTVNLHSSMSVFSVPTCITIFGQLYVIKAVRSKR